MPQHLILTNTPAAAPDEGASSSRGVCWILIERCPDVNRYPQTLTPEGTAAGGSEEHAVRALLTALEQPFLQGGGGVAPMLQPRGPHAGAVVEIRAIRKAAGEPVAGYATPQIIGWGGVDDVEAILRRNARLLRDLAFPEGSVTVSCEYYFGTRL